MATNYISTKELRENFGKVKSYMEAGEPLILLYRSAPFARIQPINPKKKKEMTIKEKLAKIEELAGGFEFRDATAEEMDNAYEESYER